MGLYNNSGYNYTNNSGYIWLYDEIMVVYLPLWKMMEFVSWDDEIPNIIEK